VAHRTEQTGFPAVPLDGGMIIRLRALSPTTDAEVAGVTCSQWAIYGRDDSAEPEGPLPDLPVLVIPIEGVE
jgi:hypothetical protein